MTDEEFLAWLDGAAGRFDRRPDEIVGVPMILAVDAGDPPPGDDPVGADFARAVRLMEARGQAVGSREVARIMEALAEREVGG
jgi:hypothetical protein